MAKPHVWPIIGAKQAAELIGVTPHRLRQLVRDKHIKERGRNKYSTLDVSTGYIGFLKAEERRTSKSAGASAVSEARARLLQVQIAEREGGLERIALAGAMAAVDDVVGQLVSDLYSIPARVSQDLAVRKKVESEIERVLAAASAVSSSIKKGGRKVADADEAEDEGDT